MQPSAISSQPSAVCDCGRLIPRGPQAVQRPGGPWPPTPEEKHLLEILLAHRGAAHPIQIKELVARLGLPEREIKSLKKSLVENFGVAIGGSRVPPYGYFLISTAEELEQALRPQINEIRSLARHVRLLAGHRRLEDVFGQIALELEKEPKASTTEVTKEHGGSR